MNERAPSTPEEIRLSEFLNARVAEPPADERTRVFAAERDEEFDSFLGRAHSARVQRDREATRVFAHRCFLAFCVLCGVLLLSALFVPATRAALKAAQETPQP